MSVDRGEPDVAVATRTLLLALLALGLGGGTIGVDEQAHCGGCRHQVRETPLLGPLNRNSIALMLIFLVRRRRSAVACDRVILGCLFHKALVLQAIIA